VLEVTENLQQAKDLEYEHPDLLTIGAILRLPPLMSLDGETAPNDINTLRQRLPIAVDSRTGVSAYNNGLRRVHAKLVKGVTAKGQPNTKPSS
jgi:hypothetical protein